MAWFTALKVGVSLVAVLFVLPRIVFPAPKIARDVIDRLAIDLVRITAMIVALVHVLVPLGLFQWLGVVLIGSAIVYVRRIRHQGIEWKDVRRHLERSGRITLYLIEGMSPTGNERVQTAVRTWWRRDVLGRLRPARPKARSAAVVGLAIPLTLLLLGSLVVRVHYVLTHWALVPADNYVHLAWLQYLPMGELYHDGIYPQGMHAVLAFVSRIAPVGSYDMVRFAGAFMNTLFVFVVYAVARRATRSSGPAMLAAAVVGLIGIRNELGLSASRQIGALPQEFAALIGLLGVLMALEYVARPSRQRLLYLAMAGFTVSMSHPLGAGLVIASAGVGGLVAALKPFRPRVAIRAWAFAGAGLILGHLYVPAAMLAGRRIYGAVSNINPVATTDPLERAGPSQLEVVRGQLDAVMSRPVWALALVGAAVGLLYGLWRLARRDRHGLVLIALATFLIGSVGLSVSGMLDGWYGGRWRELITPLIPIGIALGIAPVRGLWARRSHFARSAIAVATGTAMVASLVVLLPPHVAKVEAAPVEYENAARAQNHIIRTNEPRTYTIVGPPAAYPRVLGAGFHVQLIDFTDHLDLHQAMDPGFEVPIPTRRAYVLVEKEAFVTGARRGIDEIVVNRYYDVERRQRLMDDVDAWMRVYDRFHRGVRVVHEDKLMRVWLIEHLPNVAYADRYEIVARIR